MTYKCAVNATRIIGPVFCLGAINSEWFIGQICAPVFENQLVRRSMRFLCEMLAPLMEPLIQWAPYVTFLGTKKFVILIGLLVHMI
jgi:hypothetical protein